MGCGMWQFVCFVITARQGRSRCPTPQTFPPHVHYGVRCRPVPASHPQHSARLPIHHLPRVVYDTLVHPACGSVHCVSRFPITITIVLAYTCLPVFLRSPTSRRRYRSQSPRSASSSAPPDSVPGVSILRPLKGLDTNLFENLESTFHQEYPNFEIVFSVANEYDQALPVVQTLLEKYPHSNARVIVGTDQLIHVSAGDVD